MAVRKFIKKTVVLSIIFYLFIFTPVQSQQPIDIRTSVIIIQSYRYMQNTPDASDIIRETIVRKQVNNYVSHPFSDKLELLGFKNPLADDAFEIYRYNLLRLKHINSNDCYEIAFFAQNPKENAFAGYLYIDVSTYVLHKAVFTLNNPAGINFMGDVLITHSYTDAQGVMCPLEEEIVVEMQGGFFTLRMEKLIDILLSNYVTVGGSNGKVELGPLLQLLSYNDMEGVRLRIGGNTTTAWKNQLQLGGYVAYGTKDRQWKYRGNLIYSFLPRNKYIWEYPKRLLSFTYVNDLNIPGQDLLTTNRDNILYSFSQTATNNMSLQKTGQLTFENENEHHFSYIIGAKYTSDTPAGVVEYMKVSGMDTTIIDRLNTAELALSMRYSPNEHFFQIRDRRIPIRKGDFEFSINHRIGIKGIAGSDYSYQITSTKAYKKFNLGNAGSLNTRLSAGMIWNKVPFPLLFIPEGNQSYIYQTEDFNLMHFQEFTTDRFIAGNIDFLFNWSPAKWFDKQNKIKTSLGARTIYGPLSDKNNPALHSDLFIFNKGITPLGKTPYTEINAGLVNVFKFLRIEYAHRLTYTANKSGLGALLISGNYIF